MPGGGSSQGGRNADSGIKRQAASTLNPGTGTTAALGGSSNINRIFDEYSLLHDNENSQHNMIAMQHDDDINEDYVAAQI